MHNVLRYPASALACACLSLPVWAQQTNDTSTTTASPSDSASLDTVTVTGQSAATKTETPFLETPQAVSTITREDMVKQGAKTVQRAANYTPGVYTNQVGASNRYDYMILRGFSDGSINNIFLDGLKLLGDGGGYSSMTVDPYFLDSIEVVKGPSSVLYGRASPGGLVALSSKMPLFEDYHQIQFSAGNNNQRSAAFDFSGPLDAERRVAYRLVGLSSKSDTQFGPTEEERYAIAPSLTWDATDDTTVTFMAYLQKDPEGGYHAGLPYDGTVASHNGIKLGNNFYEGDEAHDEFDRTERMFGYDLEHRFSKDLIARQKLRYLSSEVDLEQVYAYGWASDTELTRYYSGAHESLSAWTVDNQLESHFDTGAVGHTLLFGADYQDRTNDVTWDSGTAEPLDVTQGNNSTSISLYDTTRQKRDLKQTGVYLQDQMNLDRWYLTLGLRQDWVDIENTNRDTGASSKLDDTQTSGRAGLLYRFDNGISPFISYSTSFTPNTTTDQNGDLLKPTKGKQIETGVKFQPNGTQDQYTVSLFHIRQENVSTKYPNETFFRPIGEIESQGVELEARAHVTNNFALHAGYSYTDVKYVRTADGTEGNWASQVPRHQASLWGNYTFDRGSLDGLDAGLGVRYYADIYADDANTHKVPDYTLVDATLGYDLGKLGLNGVDARLNVNNLLDKEYVASCYNSTDYCYFGAERNVTATVSYQF